MGGGYATFAYRVEGGVNVEGTHLIFRGLAAYDNGRKADDNTQPNPNGHGRYLDSGIYFRPALPGWKRGLYFGGGYRWSQLSTTNYSKSGSRYQLGGGYDWFWRQCDGCRRDFSVRVHVDWVTAGSDCQKGEYFLMAIRVHCYSTFEWDTGPLVQRSCLTTVPPGRN